jgi:hypothetical protein
MTLHRAERVAADLLAMFTHLMEMGVKDLYFKGPQLPLKSQYEQEQEEWVEARGD